MATPAGCELCTMRSRRTHPLVSSFSSSHSFSRSASLSSSPLDHQVSSESIIKGRSYKIPVIVDPLFPLIESILYLQI